MEEKSSKSIRSAMTILPELREGQVITQLSAAIHDALAAVKEHNKGAEVVLRIRIDPFKATAKLVEPAVTITADVDSKLPKEVPPSTLFFISDDGNPERNPQRQQTMFRDVTVASAQEG